MHLDANATVDRRATDGSLVQTLIDNRDQPRERSPRRPRARSQPDIRLAIEGVALRKYPAHVRERLGIATALHAMVALANHPIPMFLWRGLQPDRIERI